MVGVVRPALGGPGSRSDAYGTRVVRLVHYLRHQRRVDPPPRSVVSTVAHRRVIGRASPARTAGHAGGLLVVFVVDDIDDQYTRLQSEGVEIVTPIETEPWGERCFHMADPNGVIHQLVQWVDTPGT